MDNNHHSVDSIDQFDILSNSWTTITHMRSARVSPSCVLLDGCVYVLGGGWEGGRVKEEREVDVLDLEKKDWKKSARKSIPSLWEHSTVALYVPRKP